VDYSNWHEKTASVDIGGFYTENHGNYGGAIGFNADAQAFANGYTQKDVYGVTICRRGWHVWTDPFHNVYTRDLFAGANAYATGDITGFAFTIGGPRTQLGVSVGHADLYANAWSYNSGPGYWGSAGAHSHVDGFAEQWNGIDVFASDGPSFAAAGGGNLTGASFSGDDWGFTHSSVYGMADGCGVTVAGGIVRDNFVAAGALTKGSSWAYTDGVCANTTAYGMGSVGHMAVLNTANASLMTSGDASFSYNNTGANYASGSGIALTHGTARVYGNNGGFSVESHSYANSGHGCLD
jgi:hypothetical protein